MKAGVPKRNWKNCEIVFQDIEKVLIFSKMYTKYWKSMEIPNSAICLFKFCSNR